MMVRNYTVPVTIIRICMESEKLMYKPVFIAGLR